LLLFGGGEGIKYSFEMRLETGVIGSESEVYGSDFLQGCSLLAVRATAAVLEVLTDAAEVEHMPAV
jgi:hypothetical protein